MYGSNATLFDKIASASQARYSAFEAAKAAGEVCTTEGSEGDGEQGPDEDEFSGY
jgi:hypothetical protein